MAVSAHTCNSDTLTLFAIYYPVLLLMIGEVIRHKSKIMVKMRGVMHVTKIKPKSWNMHSVLLLHDLQQRETAILDIYVIGYSMPTQFQADRTGLSIIFHSKYIEWLFLSRRAQSPNSVVNVSHSNCPGLHKWWQKKKKDCHIVKQGFFIPQSSRCRWRFWKLLSNSYLLYHPFFAYTYDVCSVCSSFKLAL